MEVTMSEANIRRSTPGYVYGCAVSYKGETEGKPSCACPCHVAKAPDGAKGYSCDRCHNYTYMFTIPPSPVVAYTHKQAVRDGTTDPQPYMVPVVDYWFVTKGNRLDEELGEHFATEEEAEARAEALNDADVLAMLALKPEFLARRERLKALGETFHVRYGEGPREARWPKEPDRYAVSEYSERYGDWFWKTCETLDEVRAAIEGRDVNRVVDLDTGADVEFTVSVEFAS